MEQKRREREGEVGKRTQKKRKREVEVAKRKEKCTDCVAKEGRKGKTEEKRGDQTIVRRSINDCDRFVGARQSP